MSEKILSIAICSFNRASFIKKYLPVLLTQVSEHPACNKIEILIINNNSTDDTSKLADYFSNYKLDISVIDEKKNGLCHARNCALSKSKGIFIVYLDDDACVHEKWLETVLIIINKKLDIYTFGGPIYPNFENDVIPWWIDSRDFIRFRNCKTGPLSNQKAKYGFNGGNMGFDKQKLIDIGGFSPEYNFTNTSKKITLGEENDVALKLFKRYGNNTFFHNGMGVSHFESKYKTTLSGYLNRYLSSGSSIFNLHEDENKKILFNIAFGLSLFIVGTVKLIVGLASAVKAKPSSGIIRLAQSSTYIKCTFKKIFSL